MGLDPSNSLSNFDRYLFSGKDEFYELLGQRATVV